jgi:hypothetical protein
MARKVGLSTPQVSDLSSSPSHHFDSSTTTSRPRQNKEFLLPSLPPTRAREKIHKYSLVTFHLSSPLPDN